MRRELRVAAGTSLRRGLPRMLPDEVERRRVVDRLALRWSQTVTVVEAPAGYGKSTALAQAVRDNEDDPSGIDCYVSCRSVDREPHAFTQAVVASLGADQPPTAEDIEGLADTILDRLSAYAPEDVCLILDDVHNLDGESVKVLSQVVRELPMNGHILLCGRSIPPIPLARFRAQGEVSNVGVDELSFSTEELHGLATSHGVDPAILHDVQGWPALTRLSLVARRDVSAGFILEEVVGSLDDRLRVGMAATIIAKRVDDAVLRQAADIDITTAELARRVPLVMQLDGGDIAAHDIWHDVLEELMEPQHRREIAARVAGLHLQNGRIDECIEIYAADGNWGEAKRAVMHALEKNDAELGAGTAARWLGMFPPEQSDEPEVRLLRGIAARLSAGPASGMEDVEAALTAFLERDNRDYLACVLVERGVRAWLLNDSETITALAEHVTDLAAAGNRQMQALLSVGLSSLADLAGDPEAAMAHHLEVDFDTELTGVAELFLRTRSSYAFLLGRGDDGVEYARQVAQRTGSLEAQFWLAVAHWQNGNPDPFVELPDEMRRKWRQSRRDEFLKGVFSTMADASSGISHRISDGLVSSHQRSRERAFETLSRCAEYITDGREAEAKSAMTALVERLGPEDRQAYNELARFTAYGYVLNDDIRRRLDDFELGERFQRARTVARALHRARSGMDVPWSALPPPPEIQCSLPLPWSAELAAHASGAGAPIGPVLADYLLDRAPVATNRALATLADSDGPASAGATTLLRDLPTPPSTSVGIKLCGQLEIAHGDADPTPVSRARVRQLLATLVLNGRTTRAELVRWLWPAMDDAAAQNNLRVALAHLRALLEPDRRRGSPSFHVRDDGRALWLHRSDQLQIDVWQIDALVRDSAASAGTSPHRAAAAAAEAAELWTDQSFLDVRDVDELAPTLVAWDGLATEAAIRAAQWDLAQGNLDRSAITARRILDQDHHHEPAWQILIGIDLARGDLDAAGRTVEGCLAALAELGVEPTHATASLAGRYRREHQAPEDRDP